jgi:2,4-dienoyl-CoA reductase-like NADH-dependent reductase (Old Yellow Enzyme family)
MPDLFSEYTLKDVRLKNRIVVSPMCQYSAVEGVPNAWHHAHLGSMAIGGAGLVVAEATAILPEGRITPGDTGLWNDEQTEAFRPIVSFVESLGAVPGIQLGHAGRKASMSSPWAGDTQFPTDHPDAWEPFGPSAVALGGNAWRTPRGMTKEDIAHAQDAFAKAAGRARDAGFKWLELHFAHGFLAQSFFSPIANRRTDEYGGSFENRSRFLLETLAKVREVWPESLPLTVRLGVAEYVEGETPFEETIQLAKRMKEGGLDLLDASLGFNTPDVSGVPWGEPAFLAHLAGQIRNNAGIPVGTSWNIADPKVADELIRNETLDLVFLAKALLDDPHWPYHAAQRLGKDLPQNVLPVQYAVWLKRQAPPTEGD